MSGRPVDDRTPPPAEAKPAPRRHVCRLPGARPGQSERAQPDRCSASRQGLRCHNVDGAGVPARMSLAGPTAAHHLRPGLPHTGSLMLDQPEPGGGSDRHCRRDADQTGRHHRKSDDTRCSAPDRCRTSAARSPHTRRPTSSARPSPRRARVCRHSRKCEGICQHNGTHLAPAWRSPPQRSTTPCAGRSQCPPGLLPPLGSTRDLLDDTEPRVFSARRGYQPIPGVSHGHGTWPASTLCRGRVRARRTPNPPYKRPAGPGFHAGRGEPTPSRLAPNLSRHRTPRRNRVDHSSRRCPLSPPTTSR